MRGKLIALTCLCLMMTGCSNKAFGGDAGGWKNSDSMTEYDNRSKSGSDSTESSEPEIVTMYEYHSLDNDDYISAANVDGGLGMLKENANNFYTESSPFYAKTLKLQSNDLFELWETIETGGQQSCVFAGSYTVSDDGTIEFRYELCRQGNKLYSISDVGDIPDKMRGMNTTGSYTDFINPPAAQIQRDDIYSELPIMLRLPITDLPYAITSGRYDMELFIKGDLVCTRTYGAELSGSYEAGKDFVIDFDPAAIYTGNPLYSDESFYDKKQTEELVKTVKTAVGEDTGTKISFSAGKWTWTAGKKTIAGGTYSESSEYPGLIRIVPDDPSSNRMVSWFYITDDGIYYPYMMLTKQEEK